MLEILSVSAACVRKNVVYFQSNYWLEIRRCIGQTAELQKVSEVVTIRYRSWTTDPVNYNVTTHAMSVAQLS